MFGREMGIPEGDGGRRMPEQVADRGECHPSFYPPIFCFADFTGPGVAVLDGDTIEVLHEHPDVGVLIHASIPTPHTSYPNYVNC